jgi:pimeloyl-ACP methyl ester carboxylesterase
MPFVQVNETELFYVDEGAGNSIVFVPGLGATHDLWGPQLEAFRGAHRVISFDPRGNGKSGKLTGPVSSILDRQCDDVAALLDRLGIARALFVGVSYGGVFTQHFVLRHPARVRAMVLVDTFSDTKPPHLVDRLICLGNYNVWANYLPRPWLKRLMGSMWSNWPAAQERMLRIMDSWRAHEATLQRLAIMGAEHTSKLRAVACPALGIAGDRTATGVRLMQRTMAALPGSRLEVVHDAFDPTNLCQVAIFNDLLAGFLAEIGW